MKIGKVKCFNSNKGYGFIKPEVGVLLFAPNDQNI
jgi:cold shock CspA family protein